jgi:hypothetical protein
MNEAWERPPEYDDPPDQPEEYEMLIECDFCDGTGQTTCAWEGNGRICFDCPECGGTGWA